MSKPTAPKPTAPKPVASKPVASKPSTSRKRISVFIPPDDIKIAKFFEHIKKQGASRSQAIRDALLFFINEAGRVDSTEEDDDYLKEMAELHLLVDSLAKSMAHLKEAVDKISDATYEIRERLDGLHADGHTEKLPLEESGGEPDDSLMMDFLNGIQDLSGEKGETDG